MFMIFLKHGAVQCEFYREEERFGSDLFLWMCRVVLALENIDRSDWQREREPQRRRLPLNKTNIFARNWYIGKWASCSCGRQWACWIEPHQVVGLLMMAWLRPEKLSRLMLPALVGISLLLPPAQMGSNDNPPHTPSVPVTDLMDIFKVSTHLEISKPLYVLPSRQNWRKL